MLEVGTARVKPPQRFLSSGSALRRLGGAIARCAPRCARGAKPPPAMGSPLASTACRLRARRFPQDVIHQASKQATASSRQTAQKNLWGEKNLALARSETPAAIAAEGQQLCKAQARPGLVAAALTRPPPPGADMEAVAVGADGETAPCPSPAFSWTGGVGAAQGGAAPGPAGCPQQLCHVTLGTSDWPAGCAVCGTGCAEARGGRERAGVRQGSSERALGSAGCTRASASPGTHAPLLYCKHLSSIAACLF